MISNMLTILCFIYLIIVLFYVSYSLMGEIQRKKQFEQFIQKLNEDLEKRHEDEAQE